MSQIIAYIRVSTSKQDIKNQKLEIFEYARKHNLNITKFIEVEVSSKKSIKSRRIEELLEKLKETDTLIITELSRLGRSTSEVIDLVNQLIKNKIRLIAIKQGLDITAHDMASKVMVTMFSLFSELERDLISSRTKEALATKKSLGIKLGKPKGTIQRSKFDDDIDKIKELLLLGLSVRKIANYLGLSNHIGLNNYVVSRKLKQNLHV
ncbi:resolvase [Francisella halioticida]|uniref:Resolvase n=1 Tax=Francisella halioticida TaxID=549298 RepID=A0ABN5AX97_9GAMM|nr:recombinase family protein [Francisella halioticida]ASG67349.1 resolvase [Francisella halioticida]ASG68124.1 resolvase [Francisella halioticida]